MLLAQVQRFRQATAGQLLVVYLAVRELGAAVGLTGLGGHVQMVRPLIAPMTEGAAEAKHGPLPDRVRYKLRAFAAATDNVGLFFGEDIFFAFGAIVLITTFLHGAGIDVDLRRLNDISDSTPVLVDLKPTGPHYMEDLFAAGGIGAVLRELKGRPRSPHRHRRTVR